MMAAAVAIIVPVMRRPHNVQRMIDSLARSGAGSDCEMYFIADHDDEEELAALEAAGANIVLNHSLIKSFAVKCNLGYLETDEDWMLLVGDDVKFHDGWLDEAFRDDDGRSLISTNDLFNRNVLAGLHATHPLIRREWADRHGASWDGEFTVCHNGYRHWYVDNEWTRVAFDAGEFRFASRSIVEHLHPLASKAADDDVYRLGRSQAAADHALYLERFGRFARAL